MSTMVIWLGANYSESEHHERRVHRTHALDCRWAATAQENQGREWPRVPASSVPADVLRCGYCGGGR